MSVIIFLLVAMGLFAACNLTPKNIRKAATNDSLRPIIDVLADTKRQRLKGKRRLIERLRDDFRFTLEASGTVLSPGAFLGITAPCVCVGVGLGLYLGNRLLSIVAAGFCAWLPYQYLIFRGMGYRRLMYTQLESALTTLTNAYMQSNDLISSVTNCLPEIEEPLKSILRDELVWKYNLSCNLEKAIRSTDRRVNNKYFHEWCECMIRCQHNRNQKIGLLPIARRLTDIKRHQAKVDTATVAIWKDHIIISIIAVGSLPAIRLLNTEWYSFLRNTLLGQIIVCLTFAAVGIGTLYVFRINKPVALEE